MLDAHGEDVDADDEGDEDVQVVAGAQRVDGQTQGRVVGVVRPLLGLWKQPNGRTITGETKKERTRTDREKKL